MIQVGDYVVRISYNRDVMFKVIEIKSNGHVRLKGISFRIIADAWIDDLELASGMRFTTKESRVMEKIQESMAKLLAERERSKKIGSVNLEKTGKVLHVDGDAFYLGICMKYYEMLGVHAVGETVLEVQQPKRVKELVQKYSPDILVLTGHDALNKNYEDIKSLGEYKNTKYFAEAVIEARKVNKGLIIFAGACQSNFEALLDAGADYAASPSRVLIHALDPVFVVERIAHWPFNEVLSIEQAIEYTITKYEGVGGFEVFGTARKGGPIQQKLMKGKTRQVVQCSIEGLDKAGLMRAFRSRQETGKSVNQRESEESIETYVGNSMPSDKL